MLTKQHFHSHKILLLKGENYGNYGNWDFPTLHFPLVARAKLEHLIPPIPIFISDHSSLSHRTQNNKSLSNDDVLSLPPSPPRLPVIGNLHQVRWLQYRSFQALSNKYGPLMLRQYLGHRPTLSSADLVKEITKNHDIIFSNRPKATGFRYLVLWSCLFLHMASIGNKLGDYVLFTSRA